MRKQKKAVIDIDNTLWHFCDVLFERLQKMPLLGILWMGNCSFVYFFVCHSGLDPVSSTGQAPESSDFCLTGYLHTDHANKD